VASGDATTDRSGGSPSTGRFARWLSGWRVAIRIARRDARRYKWRSALIVVMVGLPVLLLTAGITLIATSDVSLAESVPRVMGSAQARIYDIGAAGRVFQSPDGRSNGSTSGGSDARAVPGFALDSGWTTSKVRKLTGGRVIQMFNSTMRVTLGDRRPRMQVLGIDARDPLARGMTELVYGRWASSASEIVVTEAGIANGLPRHGQLTTAGPDGKPRQLTVVGVATGQTDFGQLPYLIALPDLVAGGTDQGPSAFLLQRSDPVTWSDVRAMNDYGLLVQSRAVYLNPPPTTQVDPQIAQTIGSNQRSNDLVLLLAAVGLFIETTLLAGPAFAVSAARQRRSLALAASNGAEARQLRRYVLGQAVVLGVVSATVAVVAGVLLTLGGLTWWKAGHADFATGPFEVSWPRVVGVFICALVASVIAALLPAKGIARLDIVSVLAGRSGDGRARRGLPAIGVVVMVLSGIAIFWGVASGGEGGIGLREYLIVGGAVGLVLGCLMVIPALLALVGRLGTHLALSLRLAARDTARQRGRSTPAVAAIMAAVAVLTTLSIAEASYDRKRESTYQPQGPMGAGIIMLGGEDASERGVRSVTNRFAPQLVMEPVGQVVDTAANPKIRSKVSWVTPVPRNCTEAEILARRNPDGGVGGVAICESLTSTDSGVQVGSLSSLAATLPLSTSQRAVLQGGGALITDPSLVRDAQVSYVAGTATQDRSGATTAAKITQRTSLPAVVVNPQRLSATSRGFFSAWILPETATRLGWPVLITSLDVTSPSGTISAAEERAVSDRLGDEYTFRVERGYQDESLLILLVLFSVAGLLVLIASLISTALSLAESQNDMATLAAVGATRHTRRGIAGAQALVVAACGCLLGVGVGLVPGIASTWPLTVRAITAGGQTDFVTGHTAPVIVIPWLPLLALILVVPLLAGAFSWIAVRRHPQMTRRLA
jgi:putative ABC transport system permease protein